MTIAGSTVQDGLGATVSSPKGIFIDKLRNLLYISDGGFSGRVQSLSLNQTSNETIIVATNLIDPNRFYVDDDVNGSIIYITLPYLNYVEKWLPGATRGIRIGGYFSFCEGVSVDNEKNVYVSEGVQNCISKWSPETNEVEW